MRQQKLLNPEAKVFKKSKLLEKYIAKTLFGQNDGKFKDEYLKKLERSWVKWKGRQVPLKAEL